MIRNTYSIGILFKLLNLLIFTIISLGLVLKSKSMNAIDEFFIICVSGTLFLLSWVVITKARHLKTANLKNYFFRAILSIGAMITWIEALKHLGPNEATLIGYLIPIFTVILASVFNEEKLNLTPFIAGIACLGVIFFALKPQIISVHWWGIFTALSSAILFAFYELICKKQTYTEHYLSQAFYTFLFAAFILFPLVSKEVFSLPMKDLLGVSILGVLRVLNVICLFLAFKFTPINLLMPFSYLRLVFMAIGTFLLFNQIPSVHLVIAAIAIVCINLYIFREQKIGKIVVEKKN